MGERYDMNHVYYVDDKYWHGAEHYYEYPCVFSWVLFHEYLGVRPALDADLLIAPRFADHGEVTLGQAPIGCATASRPMASRSRIWPTSTGRSASTRARCSPGVVQLPGGEPLRRFAR